MNEIVWLGNVCPTKTRDNPNQGRVYDINGLAPCVNTAGGGNLEPMIVVEDNKNDNRTQVFEPQRRQKRD